jgi:glycosyltransferase involved in cell wall biosynthesis
LKLMSKQNIPKLVQCLRVQCAPETPKPCWLRSGPPLPEGVNVHGYFLSETGLGESARLVHAALIGQNIKVVACNRILEGRQNDERFTDVTSAVAPYNVGLSITGLTGFRGLRHEICRRKHNIAHPFWELEAIPDRYLIYLKRFDSIWAPSTFVYETLISHGLKNVTLVKHPMMAPASTPKFGIPKDMLKLLFFFDFDSYSARKKPEAAIHAFKLAFKSQRDVSLTVKTRGTRDNGRRQWLEEQAAADPRIEIIDRTLTRQEMINLMADHDVFLSLHRSEGLGLGCMEALAAGKIVVATDYGGSTDFVNSKTGFPVAWQRIDVGVGEYVLGENASWADPSVDDAATQLRKIYDDPIAASLKAREGFKQLIENHSVSSVGNVMKDTLLRDGLIAG